MLVGNGYERMVKEIPEVPAPPIISFPAPLVPTISTCQQHTKEIRVGIADLIKRGVALRDKLPPGAPVSQLPSDIVSQWKQWKTDVAHFLGKNLDSADVEEFKSYDTSKASNPLHYVIMQEIGCLEELTHRLER
jgi:hypothetical protein